MARRLVFFFGLVISIGFGHLAAYACMCPGVNPSIYPPDLKKVKKYYRNEFKGAAFTGKVLSSKVLPGELTSLGDKVLEVTVEVDRAWIGVKSAKMTIYTSDNPCGSRFLEGKSYFFIPELENGRLYIAPCTYASYSNDPNGNFVDLMVSVIGRGKKLRINE